jgi:hypothetical protein
MPIDYRLYPADWKAIRRRILEREGDRCKWCGVANRARATGVRGQAYRIFLTVAYLNHDRDDCHREVLGALCQPCHLRYDAAHHARNAAATRRRRQEEPQAEEAAAGRFGCGEAEAADC